MEENKYTPEMLSSLPREALRRRLTEELRKPAAQADDALVRSLLAELRGRGTDPAFADDAAVETACENFREDTETAQPTQKHWYQSWMLKAASVVLVLGILFFALPGAAQADELSEVLSWWSDSAFQLFRPGEQPNTHTYEFKTDHPGLRQVYEAAAELGITDPVVPTWMPDGFELAELNSYPMLSNTTIYATFSSEDTDILITIIKYDDLSKTLQYEKNMENASFWDFGDTEHYVLSNNGNNTVTWVTNGIECSIITDCPEEDVYQMIKSIYTSED